LFGKNMKKIPSLLLAVALVGSAGCRSVDPSTARIPKDQQARIEGLSFTATLLSPSVKLNWPDLLSFDIINVTGASVGGFSKSKAIVGPGQCSITVEASTDWHQSATRILTFEAKAGRKYLLRPVYQGRVIEATIQDESTLEIVAKTWGSMKPNPPPAPTPATVTPPAARSAGQQNAGQQNTRR
jgi:peptidoglycan hydrolase-like protein with peptidoglycan-binding domain